MRLLMLALAAVVVCSSDAWWFGRFNETCVKQCKKGWLGCLKELEAVPDSTAKSYREYECKTVLLDCTYHCNVNWWAD
ncbi:hypothetical protein LSAT2_016011 [Lamellibrachia satsuma]|nr:hypothetical protein LSAT2_016011 [Lamellibrachia satsuma]